MTVKRPDQLTCQQKLIVKSLKEGHRALLQFSILTGKFTGYARVYNSTLGREELVHWYRANAMIKRGLVRLNGHSVHTSTELCLSF